MRSEEEIEEKIAELEPHRELAIKHNRVEWYEYFDGWIDALEWVIGEER